jgi:broad specificity phosphatase PhoE
MADALTTTAASVSAAQDGAATTGSAPCRLYLIRHGTTTMNVENRYRGRRDIPLDAQGYQDAVDAARLLSQAGLAAVYTGPLRRTIATAQIIADEARIPDLRILHGLNNVDYGAWEGMTAEEAAMYDPAAFELYRTDPDRAVCPNGERLTDAQNRVIEALELIGSRHPGESVAVVTHAVMIRLVVAKVHASPGGNWRIPVGRGSLSHFSIQDGVISLTELPRGDDVD